MKPIKKASNNLMCRRERKKILDWKGFDGKDEHKKKIIEASE